MTKRRIPGRAPVRVAPLLAAVVWLAACEDVDPPAVDEERRGQFEAHDAGDVGPAPAEVFLRQPASSEGWHQVLHILVPPGVSTASIRQMLFEELPRTGEADSTVAAVRAVVYMPRPRSADEADLEPVAWGEWLPAEGWEEATPRSRRNSFYRVYTYFGAAPW